MGAYNELIKKCGNKEVRIQFKHGLCWQYIYHVGDKINWEPLERPNFATGKIVVPGIAGKRLHKIDLFFAITIENDIIKDVKSIPDNEFEKLEYLYVQQTSQQ